MVALLALDSALETLLDSLSSSLFRLLDLFFSFFFLGFGRVWDPLEYPFDRPFGPFEWPFVSSKPVLTRGGDFNFETKCPWASWYLSFLDFFSFFSFFYMDPNFAIVEFQNSVKIKSFFIFEVFVNQHVATVRMMGGARKMPQCSIKTYLRFMKLSMSLVCHR